MKDRGLVAGLSRIVGASASGRGRHVVSGVLDRQMRIAPLGSDKRNVRPWRDGGTVRVENRRKEEAFGNVVFFCWRRRRVSG